MTPAQIESAARELCKARGLDPDAEIVPSCFVAGCRLHVDMAKLEVAHFAQVGTAIAAALHNEKVPVKRKKRLDNSEAHL
jgi:hypothetical protein